uniref:Uncharacterized protein n=1 Tax=Rhizophora mucronata TaxID=61149 RepID=A0A2P2QH13_RHIMU
MGKLAVKLVSPKKISLSCLHYQ